MGDHESRVVYKAIADFSSVSREARRAKDEIDSLKRAEAELNAEQAKGSAERVRASKVEQSVNRVSTGADPVGSRQSAMDTDYSTQSVLRHAAATAASASALREQAEAHQQVQKAQQSVGGRHQLDESSVGAHRAPDVASLIRGRHREAEATTVATNSILAHTAAALADAEIMKQIEAASARGLSVAGYNRDGTKRSSANGSTSPTVQPEPVMSAQELVRENKKRWRQAQKERWDSPAAEGAFVPGTRTPTEGFDPRGHRIESKAEYGARYESVMLQPKALSPEAVKQRDAWTSLSQGSQGAKGAKDGEEYAGSYERAAKTRIAGALKSLPPLEMIVGTTEADEALRAFHARLTKLKAERIGVTLSAEEFNRQAAEIIEMGKKIGHMSPSVHVGADVSEAIAKLEVVKHVADETDRKVGGIGGGGGGRGGGGELGGAFGGLQKMASAMPLMLTGILALLPLLAPLLATAVAGVVGLGAAFTALGAGLGVTLLGFHGIMGAIQAQGAVSASAKADRKAQVAQDLADSRSVAAARISLRNVTIDTAISMAAAIKNHADAERAVVSATHGERDALWSLIDTQKAAKRQLEDLAQAQKDGALAARGAALSVADAQRNLLLVLADPRNTNLQKERAALEVDQAKQSLANTLAHNKRTAQDKATADKLGVEGSHSVIQAHEAVTASVQAKIDAVNAEELADASLAEGKVRAAQSVTAAQVALSDALKQQTLDLQTGSAAEQDYAKKMAALTPAGREFVKFVTGTLKPAFKDLVATAQTNLLPGVEGGLKAMLPLLPVLNEAVGKIAKAMGDLFLSAGKALGSPFWKDFFKWLGDFSGPMLKDLGSIFGDFAKGIASIFMAFSPTSKSMMDGFANMMDRFAKWAANLDKSDGFKKFIAYVKENGPKVMATLGSIWGALEHIVESLAPMGGPALDLLKGFADGIKKLPAGVIQDILKSLLLLKVFSMVGGFKWIGLLGSALTGLATKATVAATAEELAAAGGAGGVLPGGGTTILPGGGKAAKAGRAGRRLPRVLRVAKKIPLVVDVIAAAETANAVTQAAQPGTDRPKWDQPAKPVGWWHEQLLGKPNKNLGDDIRRVYNPSSGERTNDWLNRKTGSLTGGFQDAGLREGKKHIAEADKDLASWVKSGNADKAAEVLGKYGVSVQTATKYMPEYAKALKEARSHMDATTKAQADVNSGVAAFPGLLKNDLEWLDKHGKSLDYNTDAGTRVLNALQKQSTASHIYARQVYDTTLAENKNLGPAEAHRLASVASGKATMASRDALLEAMKAHGKLTPIMHATIDSYYGINRETLKAVGATKAHAEKVQALRDKIALLEPKTVGVKTKGTDIAKAQLRDLKAELAKLTNKTITVTAQGAWKSAGWGVLSPKGQAAKTAEDNLFKLAQGGPVPMMPGAVRGKDSVAAMLTPNEFVVTADGSNIGAAIKYFGKGLASGGPVGGRYDFGKQGQGHQMGSDYGHRFKTMAGNQAASDFMELLSGMGGGGSSPGSGSGSSKWANVILTALDLLKQSRSLLGAVERRIQFESSGDPEAINLTDSNARAGHPSQGLMQVIPTTFAAHAGAFFSRGITDPLANIFAGLHYAIQRYGSINAIDPRVRHKGYAGGGVIPGYSPGHDSVSARLSPGEGILVPEAVRGIGGATAVHAINAVFNTRRGGSGFANGGVWGDWGRGSAPYEDPMVAATRARLWSGSGLGAGNSRMAQMGNVSLWSKGKEGKDFKGMHIESITINNPVGQTTEESLATTSRKLSYTMGWG